MSARFMIARSILPKSTQPPEERLPRVLVVEDDAQASALLRVALETSHALHACDARGAVLQTLRIVDPEIVVIASRTARVAFELCGAIRAMEEGQSLPIVLVTAVALDEETVARTLLSGVDDVVVAGRHHELRARVRVQLRNKRDRDRLKRLRLERDVYHVEAKVDALTGLCNRRTFDARVAEAHAKKQPYAVLFVDVDHFKRVNDARGHDAGDEVLRAIAQCLYRSKRAGDTVARWGGEEFVVLVPDADLARASDQAETLRRAVESLAIAPLGGSGVTVSVGLAVHEEPEEAAVTCRRADAALYEAKRAGRNRVAAAPRGHASPKSSIVRHLDQALASGRAGLPLLPEAAREALRLAEDPKTDIARIARLVDRDPALAARFVSIASSAAYAGRFKPTTTTHAIVRIGLLASRDLLLQAVYQRAADEMRCFGDAVARSFDRSVVSARASQMLAPWIAPGYDLAYLCGLLHDIGEARIYRILADHAPAHEAPLEVEALVRERHESAGAEIAHAWRLPPDIVTACAAHHDVGDGAPVPVVIARAGDALARVASRGEVLDDDPDVAALARRVGGVDGVRALAARLVAMGEG